MAIQLRLQRVRTAARLTRQLLVRTQQRLTGLDPVGHGRVPRTLQLCTLDVCAVCGKPRREPLRIIYLLPTIDSPIGGNKVSYRHIETIRRLGVRCCAFHAEKPASSYTWFKHQVETLKSGHFDPRSDFLVFPEVWAPLAAKFCVPAALRYAIFVQNGYLAHYSAGFERAVVAEAYRRADLVLSISDDTTAVTQLLYPFLDARQLLRLTLSVPAMFNAGAKERLVTYMPRKLPAHAERVSLYLEQRLPRGWRLQAIHNMGEEQVAATLARSSLFLSFSELEGYGLPPLEAALAGNLVVGYTGQGGREFFAPPIFRTVENGDFLHYMAEVERAIADVESGALDTAAVQEQRRRLATDHSVGRETQLLTKFVARVRTLMQRAEAGAIEAGPPPAEASLTCVGQVLQQQRSSGV
ncbi:MAG TPA: hypothetical protein VHY19_00705 [Steroidobacteraceae bacterium]|jgi:hypothetical protein|nr:hypothetical protein [Steroidobacteraceae bacterium]